MLAHRCMGTLTPNNLWLLHALRAVSVLPWAKFSGKSRCFFSNPANPFNNLRQNSWLIMGSVSVLSRFGGGLMARKVWHAVMFLPSKVTKPPTERPRSEHSLSILVFVILVPKVLVGEGHTMPNVLYVPLLNRNWLAINWYCRGQHTAPLKPVRASQPLWRPYTPIGHVNRSFPDGAGPLNWWLCPKS